MCAESGSTSEHRSLVAGVQKMRPAKSGRDQPRQVAAMVEVRVGEDDGVDRGGVDRQRLPVALAQLLETLKQPAVDEDAMAVHLEQVLRAGHGAGGAEERQG